MKILVYESTLTGEFRVIAVDNPNNSTEANAMYEHYLAGKKRWNKKDGKLLGWQNALWLLVDIEENAPGRAVRSACDEFWRLIAKSHFKAGGK